MYVSGIGKLATSVPPRSFRVSKTVLTTNTGFYVYRSKLHVRQGK